MIICLVIILVSRLIPHHGLKAKQHIGFQHNPISQHPSIGKDDEVKRMPDFVNKLKIAHNKTSS